MVVIQYGLKNSSLTYNNTIINTYACSNELATNGSNGTQLNGIGTICHEFSHTMGYPDAYDTDYSYTGPQMGSWDLMCNGSYNGSWNGGNSNWGYLDAGYRPCGYTAFERWCAGWIEPIELTDPQKITNLKPLGGTRSGGATDHGEAYVVYMLIVRKILRESIICWRIDNGLIGTMIYLGLDFSSTM